MSISRGIDLSRAYFLEVVRPILAGRFPGMPYTAGRWGTGSDVLGLDDATSRDHDWGLRLSLLVPTGRADAVDAELARSLPARFRDLPTRFASTGQTESRHHVEVDTLGHLLEGRLGFDPRAQPTAQDWLSLTGQAVLELTAGPVFADDTGELTDARAALTWYPDDLWRHVLAADWVRIDQELPLLGRAGDVGDDRGSRIIAARLAHATMHLAFLLARRWPPYSKWFGTVFRDLTGVGELGPSIDRVLRADSWRVRQDALADALQIVLEAQNTLGLSAVDRATVPFWDRPFLQPDPAIVAQLRDGIRDPAFRILPAGYGSIEQRTDVVDILVDAAARRRATVG